MFQPLNKPQNVVECGENHQHRHKCEADLEAELLGPLAHRPARAGPRRGSTSGVRRRAAGSATRLTRPIEIDRKAARLNRAPKPILATSPDDFGDADRTGNLGGGFAARRTGRRYSAPCGRHEPGLALRLRRRPQPASSAASASPRARSRRVMPRTPMRERAERTLDVARALASRQVDSVGRRARPRRSAATPLDALTIFCMSMKLPTGWPSIETTRSPGWKPAFAAGAVGQHRCDARHQDRAARARRSCPEKITMARMKLAIGPAATIAARFQTGWAAKVTARSPGAICDGRRRGLRAGGVGVAMELDVAAERDGGEPPARAVPVREADDLGPEPEREGVDLHAAPAADEEMAELVEEHHDGQHEEERHECSRTRKSRGRGSSMPPTSGAAARAQLIGHPSACRRDTARAAPRGRWLPMR